jgi:hypothetical protein
MHASTNASSNAKRPVHLFERKPGICSTRKKGNASSPAGGLDIPKINFPPSENQNVAS